MSHQHNILDGTWLLARDPDNVGRQQHWYTMLSLPAAERTTVPGIIQQTFPGYHGVAWYTRAFTPEPPRYPQARYLLRFGVVDYLAEVWVNGIYVGQHEGGETPFTLDVTDALAAVPSDAAHWLTVRVLNPHHEPIDGIVLNETPHRNKYVPFANGGSYNYGGITESVELTQAPVVRVTDVFVDANWQTGEAVVTAALSNQAGTPCPCELAFAIAPAATGEAEAAAVVALASVAREVVPGATTVQVSLRVPDFRLWELDAPALYQATVRVALSDSCGMPASAAWSVRFGYRDFRVVDGYFQLNGRRIFVRSTHTGNHSPIGQILPPATAPDLLRRDLVYAKACGFNMVRYISGVAHPYQLDLADEIGLLVYEETLAGWLLADSPKMGERFDFSVREMILRDRNHPSVVIWGLLNETTDGPVFRHAVGMLPLVRSLDVTRLVLLSSGRWDCDLGIGSVSNPGSDKWEHVWGAEAPGAAPAPYSWKLGYPGGYFREVGDAHVYPRTPHTAATIRFLRTLGEGTQPVFLSEYGIGSVMNVIRELRLYEQSARRSGTGPEEPEDHALMRSMAEHFEADWQRYGMDGVYAFPEDMLRDSQRLHARQRLLGFDAIRANPQICGFNLTGMLDHGMTGEGVWTFWREWKPGLADAMSDGWAPLRWCLFVNLPSGSLHGYLGEPVEVEAVLANEDVLPPGEYPVRLRIVGPAGVAWEQTTVACIPAGEPGRPAPLAVPVFAGRVELAGPPGVYEFAATVEHGAGPAGGRLKFTLAERLHDAAAGAGYSVTVLEDGQEERGGRLSNWLKAHGVAAAPFQAESDDQPDAPQVVLIGDLSQMPEATVDATWQALLARITSGAVAIFLSPAVFGRGDDALARLPLGAGSTETRGRCYEFNDWLYHKECVAKAHPVLAGLAAPGVMDWDYYGPVIPHLIFDGQDTPAETMAAAFALGYSCPGGYASGFLLAGYRYGAGSFILNTFNILDNLDRHPAADRLLANLLSYAASVERQR